MNVILSEFGREMKRNLKSINDFYKPGPCSDADDIAPCESIIYLFAPAAYAIGVLEPFVEAPVRTVLNRYPSL